MGHCRYEDLGDLGEVLDEVRTWASIRETVPGVFYVKRLPFLHFHCDRGGGRWADVRDGETWGARIEIPAGAPHDPFVEELRRRHQATLGAKK